MGSETGIAWTDHTFNPWWGCVRVSPGCENCYAEAWDNFRGGPEKHWGVQAPRRFFGDKHWNEPERWNAAAAKEGKRARVFCASMADVFEDRRDLDVWRIRLFLLIDATPNLDWQLLTKRPENLARFLPPDWLARPRPNVWLGTTVEDQKRADERIPHLLKVPAAVRFLSCEPLLASLDLRPHLRMFSVEPKPGGKIYRNDVGAVIGLEAVVVDSPLIKWVIVGGESGQGARSMHLEWSRSLVAQCKAAGVATFVKQFGAKPLFRLTGSGLQPYPLELDKKHGGDPLEWPEDLRVRQFPEVNHG